MLSSIVMAFRKDGTKHSENPEGVQAEVEQRFFLTGQAASGLRICWCPQFRDSALWVFPVE